MRELAARGTGKLVCAALAVLLHGAAWAGGGPLGIDSTVTLDDKGIWKRSTQTAVLGVVVTGTIAAAFWEGGDSRLGKTLWQSVDSLVLTTAATTAGKYAFTRARPSQTSDPNLWFQGGHHYSFPSGEVGAMSAVVTPLILEYRNDHPWIWALELLPAYDAVARVKVHAHWQTDVLAGFAIGTGIGYYAHSRDSPWVLGLLPHGASVGFHKQW
ncbi:MAG TPA: phosphatase PAP2 family protein [Burkholderiales bacterium]